MTIGLVHSAVGAHNIPESVRALSSLPHIDYADHFTIASQPQPQPQPQPEPGLESGPGQGQGQGHESEPQPGWGADAAATPERWARAMFGDVPNAAELVIWRGLLGFRLDRRRSPATVAGWRIGGRGEDWIRLETASWFLTANLLVRTVDGQVSLTTFLYYDQPLGNVVWPPLSALHRRLVPGVLRGAAARIKVRREA